MSKVPHHKLHDIVETKYVIPNSFLKEYVPIKTPGDGNCLFHAVSLSLNGKLNLTRHLRLLAAYSIVQNRDKFLQIIQADCAHIQNNLTPHKYLEYIIYVARKWTEWGNEYHLLVLSVGFQRDIYCCLPFRLAELKPNQRNDPDALKALFDGH